MSGKNPGNKGLLEWYEANRRDLPWRQTRDPYRIWISEIMLQQTRVDTALPYYERFLHRFPDVERLASADLDEVLAEWSGLGYYRRARQLHAAARQIVASGGELPDSIEGLLELQGIGPYTAAAVGSIAFGIAVPVLDGNVERVLSRRLALEEDPRRGPGKKKLLAAAKALIDSRRPGDSNQALMELGATVCRPKAPECSRCPFHRSCRGLQSGDPERYPRLAKRKKPERQRWLAAVAVQGDRVLLFRRPGDSSLLAGFWEVPWVRCERPDEAENLLTEAYGGRWKLGTRHGTVRHSITYRALEIEVACADFRSLDGVADSLEAGWFNPDEMADLALSSVVAKILGRVPAEETAAVDG